MSFLPWAGPHSVLKATHILSQVPPQSRNGMSCPSDTSNTSEGPYLLLARENTLLLQVSPEWVRSIQIIFVS